jgi:hypothetical protein
MRYLARKASGIYYIRYSYSLKSGKWKSRKFSLGTKDYAAAKLRAAEINYSLEVFRSKQQTAN